MFAVDIEHLSLKNSNYRQVVNTTVNMQLVVMSLNANQEIGIEKHVNATQFIRVEKGEGLAIIYDKNKQNPQQHILKDGVSVMINGGTYHNIIAGCTGLKLYTLYSPPQHKPGLIQPIKVEENEED